MTERIGGLARYKFQLSPKALDGVFEAVENAVTAGGELPDLRTVGIPYGRSFIGEGKLNPNNDQDREIIMEHIRNWRK